MARKNWGMEQLEEHAGEMGHLLGPALDDGPDGVVADVAANCHSTFFRSHISGGRAFRSPGGSSSLPMGRGLSIPGGSIIFPPNMGWRVVVPELGLAAFVRPE